VRALIIVPLPTPEGPQIIRGRGGAGIVVQERDSRGRVNKGDLPLELCPALVPEVFPGSRLSRD
jgi:hypothetical protein